MMVLASIGLAMVRRAVRKRESLAPRKTTQTLQENKEWLQSRIQ